MKKSISILALILAGSSIFAQNKWKVGDLVMDYEFPAVVAYVDETGEHGLLLGLHKYPTFLDLNEALMPREMIERYLNGELACASNIIKDKKGKFKERKWPKLNKLDRNRVYDIKTALAASQLTSGRDIAKFIDEQCEIKNVDKSICFRDQYWAECLGDGWFIPGDAELELMSPFLSGHPIGEEFSHEILKRETFNEIIKNSPGYRIAGQWYDKISGSFNYLGLKSDCKVRGYYFAPILSSSNLSKYNKKVFANHFFVLATTGSAASKRYKAIISSGIAKIDKTLYGNQFGKWMCNSYSTPTDSDKSGYGYPFGFFSFGVGYTRLADIPTLPVKTF